ncbi:MAG: helix-turn-helix domain-containing GNAT family N-acetyltransferase [Phycisphaerae bacterium]
MTRERTDFLRELGLVGLSSRIRRLSDRWMAGVSRVYRDEGVDFNPTWFPLFRLIGEREAVAIVEAAQMLGLTHPAVSQFCKDLVRAKLITSQADRADQRRRVMRLSARGREMFDRLMPIWDAVAAAMDELLRAADVDLLPICTRLEDDTLAASMDERVRRHLRHEGGSTIRVIDFEPRHAAAFRTLNLQWLTDGRRPEPDDERLLNHPRREIVDRGGYIVCAQNDTGIVGTAALRRAEPGTFELTKMAVDRDHRNRGIGRKLLEALVDRARSAGATRIVLETDAGLPAAVHLYRKFGFKDVPLPDPPRHARSEIALELRLRPVRRRK